MMLDFLGKHKAFQIRLLVVMLSKKTMWTEEWTPILAPKSTAIFTLNSVKDTPSSSSSSVTLTTEASAQFHPVRSKSETVSGL
ncbi:unnamed protein product [Cuscuta campestris]|uniref:Uncharacterized protein n=1 Tax=Cuscuta campestris TaxID=132261 RepID=A0A484MU09_9ASTE|nr:unnamed protein product [Cuscuta campestris]